MARSATQSIDALVLEAVHAAVARALPGIQRAIDAAVDARVRSRSRAAAPRRVAGAAVRADLTHWVADRHARRVPRFVIEATGLDTKKAIVARFGDNAAFTKGKPLPALERDATPKGAEARPAVREVKARPPVIRKHAHATA